MKKLTIISFSILLLASACSNQKNSAITNTNSTASSQDQSAQIGELQKEVNQLKNQKPQVVIKEQPAAQPNLASIIQEWQVKMALVECSWQYADPNHNYSAYGSGLLTKDKFGYIYIYTNRHVVADSQGQTPSSCSVTISGDSNSYQFQNYDYTGSPNDFASEANNIGQSFYVDSTNDFAMIRLYLPDDYTKTIAATLNYCKNPAVEGNSMVILGYPAIGSQTGVTATEGIVSGTDGSYYITSAKVEHGDSGGAAILEQNDCYLGIPTYAVSGSVESLARILDIAKVGEVQYTIHP